MARTICAPELGPALAEFAFSVMTSCSSLAFPLGPKQRDTASDHKTQLTSLLHKGPS